MKESIVLFSGGLDSSLVCVMLMKHGYKVHPLFINYGQLNYKFEHKACLHVASLIGLGNVETLDIKDYGRLIPSGITNANLDIVKDAFLPGRNALFLLCASAFAYSIRVSNVAIGLLNDENSIFPDQNFNFLTQMQILITTMLSTRINIITPLSSFYKRDVVLLAKEEGIIGTYSCHAGKIFPCGNCIACKEYLGG